MASLPETVTKTDKWTMWASSPDSFRRILVEIENSFADLIDGHVEQSITGQQTDVAYYAANQADSLARAAKYSPAMVPDNKKFYENEAARYAKGLANAEAALATAEAEARSAAQIGLTLKTRSDSRKVTGTAEEIAGYLEGKNIVSASFSAPSGSLRSHSIALECDRSEGVNLRISSNSSQWTLATFDEISSSIRSGVPKTRFVRNNWFLSAFCAISIFTTYYLIMDAIASFITGGGNYPPEYTTLVGFVYLILSFGTFGLSIYLAYKNVPAFQILQPGGKPPSSALVWIVVRGLTGVLVGVVCNVIAAAITTPA
jgi:hypothetical protein